MGQSQLKLSQLHGVLDHLDKSQLQTLAGSFACAETASSACDKCGGLSDNANVDGDAAADVKDFRELPPLRSSRGTYGGSEPSAPSVPAAATLSEDPSCEEAQETSPRSLGTPRRMCDDDGLEGVEEEEDEQADSERKVVKAEIISGSFVVVIDTTDNPKGILGVHASLATVQGRSGLAIKSVSEGLIMQWNKKHVGQELKAGDVIVEVNGIHGNAKELHQLLVRIMDLKIALRMVVLRDEDLSQKEKTNPFVPPKNATKASPAQVGNAFGAGAITPKLTKEGIPGLFVGFKLPDGETRVITFTHRPLGLDFEKKCLIIINRVATGRPAALLGIEPGWVIATVNGLNVSNKDFPSVYQLFQTLAAVLPKLDRK